MNGPAMINGDQLSDADLMRAFAWRGDHAALTELAARYERTMLGMARGLLFGQDELAKDAVQETWVRVIRSAKTYRGGSSVKTWLYQVLINRCRTIGAREAQLKAKGRKHAAAQDERLAEHDLQANGLSATERDEARKELQRTVDGLTLAQREVLLLCYHAGMTHETAANVLGLPLGTLKSRLHAALEELRAKLAEEVTS